MLGDKLRAAAEVDRHTTTVTACSGRDKAVTVLGMKVVQAQ